MGIRLSLFIVLLMTISVTQCQPTITQTESDSDDCNTKEKELSTLSAEIQTMKERIQTAERGLHDVDYGMYRVTEGVRVKLNNHTHAQCVADGILNALTVDSDTVRDLTFNKLKVSSRSQTALGLTTLLRYRKGTVRHTM